MTQDTLMAKPQLAAADANGDVTLEYGSGALTVLAYDISGKRGGRRYDSVPLTIWERSNFAQPDLGLMDGRFSQGCATAMRIVRSVTRMFDDCGSRKHHHGAEGFLAPRMAQSGSCLNSGSPR